MTVPEPDSPYASCPNCGGENEANAGFCSHCGASLTATEDAPGGRWSVGPGWEIAAYALLISVALTMRLWGLGDRAMHHDESLHAYYAWNLYVGNGFQHNPLMHGPFQFEATAAIFFLLGDSDFTARLLYPLAGTALVGLPFFFRSRMGRLGALSAASLLALSPAMLYFSRFARNDILMAVWTLGLVVCMWRYLDEGKHRYLYVAAGLLALAFATKETAYIVTVTLGLYLAMVVVARNWPAVRPSIAVGSASPPAAIWRLATGVVANSARRFRLSGGSRHADFFMVLFTLSLPLGSALVGVLQNTPLLSWSGLVLVSPVDGPGPIGVPLRGGLVVAGLVVVAMIWISAAIGIGWNGRVWWRCAAIFYAVWLPLHTTFFTNIVGGGSGMWQSLGYWLVQQDVARGGQPWYYYFIITPLYEFLPLALAVAGGVYYLRRKDPFGRFLVFWSVTTFVPYMVAGEKMPWLVVNMSLPLIVLGARFLNDVVQDIPWRRVVSGGGLVTLGAVPPLLLLSWQRDFFTRDTWEATDLLVLGALGAFLLGLGILVSAVADRVGPRNLLAFAVVPCVALLLVLSVRAAWNASYVNGDIPIEMIVYTQTSPDILRLVKHVESTGDAQGDRMGVPITVDGTSGFHWPWWWYLRDYTRVGYVSYDGAPPKEAPDTSVLLVHGNNWLATDPVLTGSYSAGKRIKHRWWFPESYKGLTLREFAGAIVDPGAWRRAIAYFLFREIATPLGSEDAYVYFAEGFPEFSPSS